MAQERAFRKGEKGASTFCKGAGIAFLTSQLVSHFDLEPPCTYIGCSHTVLPKSTKKRRIDHGQEDFFYKLCPDCCPAWGYAKQQSETHLHAADDAEISSFSGRDDASSNISSTSASDVDVPHLDKNTYVSSDVQFVKKRSYASSNGNYKELIKLKHVKSRPFSSDGNASQSINEDCIHVFPTRSVSACSSQSNAGDYCDLLAKSTGMFRMPNTCQGKNLQREIATEDDTSLQNGSNEQHYILLENDDEEVYHDPFFESWEAVSGCQKVHSSSALEGDNKNISEAREVHAESAQPLLPCDINSEEEKGPSMIIESGEASNICECSEECEASMCTIKECEGEYHYVLLKSDNEDQQKAPFVKELHSESAQPLLNSISDNESEVPTVLNMAPGIGLLVGILQSSSIEQSTEDAPYHELPEVHIQTIALEEQQHQYTLLENDDEDSSEAVDSENFLSDCEQPLLQIVQEGESETSRLALNFVCAKPAVKADDSHRRNLKQLVEVNRVGTYSKGSGKLDQMQDTEALLQGFSSYQCSGCLRPSSCDMTMAKGCIESDVCPCPNVTLSDLEIVQGLRKSKKINAEEPLLDMGISGTAFGDLLEADSLEGIKASDCESKIAVTGEAVLSRSFDVDIYQQARFSELEKLFATNEKVPPGSQQQAMDQSDLYGEELDNSVRSSKATMLQDVYLLQTPGQTDMPELEKLLVTNGNAPPGSQQQAVDQSDLYGKDLANSDCSSKATMLQDAYLFQTPGQVDQLDLHSVVCLANDDANKVSLATDGCSLQDDNTTELEIKGTPNITLEDLFEIVAGDAAGPPDLGFESLEVKGKSTNGAVNTKNKESVFDVLSQMAQQGKEEVQVDKDQEDGMDVLREVLLAERKMLATLETELENERNAAAIATSEAMAMISRLQEEKSAMQLEVAQLQRMAEEKAEYDEQAMALLKEILFKREAEKHALEKEVELYRQRLSAERVLKIENKASSTWSSTSLLLLSRMDEDQGSFSPETCNKNLPPLDEFEKSESTSPPCFSKRQNKGYEKSTELNAQFAKSPVARTPKGLLVNDQVDTSMAEDQWNSSSPLIEHLRTSRPIFTSSDEETQFILDRLWVLEEELRELQGADGLGAQKKPHDIQYSECSPLSKKSAHSVIEACHGGEAGGHVNENGSGGCVPVHDVYEVRSAPSQQVQDNKGGKPVEDLCILEDSKSSPRHVMQEEELAATIHSDSSQVVPYADNTRTQLIKTTEGGLVSTDVIQQLAVRLQVLETDRELLREILESFRHKDAELKLLQEIAQQLRELRMVGFSSISTGAALREPIPATFGKNCRHVLKKRRYCSEQGQAEVILLHQRSI
ncbi:hypothetical protein GOP47_0023592 [Adiantum capillus-veneris]|uniref:GTD-binding domain-containing protein n=1 Tax=Adiantum capillus-veneris TaxID=13818 RepID=A0A9D4Z598_ADICA|nr:hypothetical protein GOP47_0023592 [Adiantum capillus-veneris]